MIDKNKVYCLKDLFDMFNMYNLDFKFYGNNDNSCLELYMKADTDKVFVFSSLNFDISKQQFLKMTKDEVMNLEFKFDREVNEMDLDIVAIVLKTSDVNIPSARYSLETLDRLTKEHGHEEKNNFDGLEDGISYLIVDNNTACPLYDGVYTFNKDNCGLIAYLKEQYQQETKELYKNNLSIILDYVEQLKNSKEVVQV